MRERERGGGGGGEERETLCSEEQCIALGIAVQRYATAAVAADAEVRLAFSPLIALRFLRLRLPVNH